MTLLKLPQYNVVFEKHGKFHYFLQPCRSGSPYIHTTSYQRSTRTTPTSVKYKSSMHRIGMSDALCAYIVFAKHAFLLYS